MWGGGGGGFCVGIEILKGKGGEREKQKPYKFLKFFFLIEKKIFTPPPPLLQWRPYEAIWGSRRLS